MIRLLFCGVLGVLTAFHRPVFAQVTYPDNFTDEAFGGVWSFPVGLVFDENGRAYVWEKSGKVFIVDNLGNRLLEPLIDISDEVLDWWDHGLLGFALDPGFLQNGHIYLLYAVDRHHLLTAGTPDYDPNVTITGQATIGRITRYTADPATDFTTIIPDSRLVLLGASPSDGFSILMPSHGLGSLVFADDGSLLASCGDAGSFDSADDGSHPGSYWEQALADEIMREEENVGAFRSLMVNSLSGKILRLDPATGEGLPGNPWFDASNPRSAGSRVWAMGMRNPFRFIQIPETGSHFAADGNPGTLLVADVGSVAWEELNVITEGGTNLGWPIYEGYFQMPFFDVYNPQNKDEPNPLFEQNGCLEPYFRFRDLIQQPSLAPEFFNPCNASVPIPDGVPTQIHHWPVISWGNANADSIVYVGRFDSTSGPEVFELEDPSSGVAGTHFNGSSSITGFIYEGQQWPAAFQGAYFHADFDGWIRTFTFGENWELRAVDTFARGTSNLVYLTLNTEEECLYWVDIVEGIIHRVCYGGLPRPVVQASADTLYGPSPLTVQFDASASFSPGGAPLEYSWDFGDGQSSDSMSPSHQFQAPDGNPFSFEVALTVTDSLGQSTSGRLIVSLNNTPPKVRIRSIEDGDRYPMDEPLLLPLQAEITDAETSNEELEAEWQIFFHHNTHFHTQPSLFGLDKQYLLAPAGCEGEAYWYRFRLRVTDPQKLEGTDEVEMFPDCGGLSEVTLSGSSAEKSIDLAWVVSPGVSLEKADLLYRTDNSGISVLQRFDAQQIQSSWTHTSPSVNKNYYRLRYRTQDGRWGYSNEAGLYPLLPTEILAFPNPSVSGFSLRYDATVEGEGSLRILDMQGREFVNMKIQHSNGRNEIFIGETAGWPSGTYIVDISGEDWDKQALLQKF